MAADVLVSDRPGIAMPALSGARRRTRRRWYWAVVAVILFGGLLASVIGNEVQATNRFDTAHHSLLANRYGIDLVVADLTGAQRQLAAVDGQVSGASTALTQETAELKAAQTALSSAQSHVSQQSTTIGALHVCLGGVEQALTALSVNDQAHAIAALQSVASSCQELAASSG
jgi:flagellin-like hook-associated protein FlgL